MEVLSWAACPKAGKHHSRKTYAPASVNPRSHAHTRCRFLFILLTINDRPAEISLSVVEAFSLSGRPEGIFLFSEGAERNHESGRIADLGQRASLAKDDFPLPITAR